GERVRAAVHVADAVAQRAISRGHAEPLDPRALVRRHRLGRELPADPRVLLGEDDAGAPLRGRERGGDAAEPCADDEDVCLEVWMGHAGSVSLVLWCSEVCEGGLAPGGGAGGGAATVSPSTSTHSRSWCSSSSGTRAARAALRSERPEPD